MVTIAMIVKVGAELSPYRLAESSMTDVDR